LGRSDPTGSPAARSKRCAFVERGTFNRLNNTAPDAENGTEDGRSELGRIYALDLLDDGNGGLEFQILNRKTFLGGIG